MSKFTNITNATIVNSVTSTSTFLTVKINNKNVGLPLFTFDDPSIELLPATPGFVLGESTLQNMATSYGVGISFVVNNSSISVPVYKIDQNEDDISYIEFLNPTIVSDLSSTSNYFVINVSDQNYGIPIFSFGSKYDSGTTTPVTSSFSPDTALNVGKPTLNVTKDSGSTYLNPKIEAYSDVIIRLKGMLGFPTINIDVCDDVIADFIDAAIELYTKYAGFTEEFLVFNTDIYRRGTGVRMDMLFSKTPEMYTTNWYKVSGSSYDYDLKEYRKVVDVWSFEQGEASGVNTLFTMEQAMAQQTYFSYQLGNAGFDLVTWDILKGWLDTRQKVLAQIPYIRFDPKSQILRILPEPMPTQNYYCVVGCYVENAIKDLIAEPWVYMYVMALIKLNIGFVRSKYGAQTLFGGGTLQYNEIMSQGQKEKEELEKQLLTGYGFADVMPAKFFLS